jgi:hypothetical protein
MKLNQLCNVDVAHSVSVSEAKAIPNVLWTPFKRPPVIFSPVSVPALLAQARSGVDAIRLEHMSNVTSDIRRK